MFGTAFYHSLEAVVINTAALLATLIGFGVFVAAFGAAPSTSSTSCTWVDSQPAYLSRAR